MGKTVAVTGANGFIGQALVNSLHEKGYSIKAFVHHLPVKQLTGVAYYQYSLETSPCAQDFIDVDILIHLAFQFRPQKIEGIDVNVYAAKALKNLNVPKYIFISSFAAADPVTPSYYGVCKRTMEGLFGDSIVIRPGLVLGNGGLFGRMRNQLSKRRWVPLLQGGSQVIQTIFIEDLVSNIIDLFEKTPGTYSVAHPDKVLYKTLMLGIARQLNKPVNFIPIPVALMRLIIAAVQIFPSPPINKDNLAGLLASKYVDTNLEYKEAKGAWLSWEQTLAKLI
jgi:uncharacterized protein YbjT (DUF2867 family)